MDNIKLILYIVFIIGYFLFKVLTGKKKPITRQNPDAFDQDRERQRRQSGEYDTPAEPKSFEEILEELAGGKKPKAVKPELIAKAQKVKKQSELAFDEAKYEANEAYREAKSEVKNFATLDERIDLENVDISIKEVEDIADPYHTSDKKNPYLLLFSNLNDAKKAIVMSEILNRKY